MEDAFERKTIRTRHSRSYRGVGERRCKSTHRSRRTTHSLPEVLAGDGHPPGIDKSALALAEPKRYRNKEHLRFVAKQPCLICGRKPSDPHHLRFTQPRALGRKVSDEFAVPLCRVPSPRGAPGGQRARVVEGRRHRPRQGRPQALETNPAGWWTRSAHRSGRRRSRCSCHVSRRPLVVLRAPISLPQNRRVTVEHREQHRRSPQDRELPPGCSTRPTARHLPISSSMATEKPGRCAANAFAPGCGSNITSGPGMRPTPAALNAALNVLEAQAQFDGPQRKVSVRVAEHDGLIYLDLADEFWRCDRNQPAAAGGSPMIPRSGSAARPACCRCRSRRAAGRSTNWRRS